MSTTSPSAPSRWKAVAVAGVTLALLWWFFKDLDVAEVGRAIAQAHLGFVGLALLVTVQTYALRAWRWQQLLEPIGRARYRVAFRTTVIGFAATFLLPGRVGEILRPYLLARSEGFSAAAVFATVIVERALDLSAVLLLFAGYVLTSSLPAGQDAELTALLNGAALVASASAVLALVLMTALAGHPERLGRWAGKLSRLLPGRLAGAVSSLVRAFAEGLAVMRRPRPLVLAFGHSLLLWTSIGLGVWLASRAFGIAFPLAGSFLVLAFLVVGVAIPTPGGAGTFHIAYSVAVTSFFGAVAETAGAAAIVLHAISFVPVTLLGLWFMAQDGLTLGGLRGLRTRAEAAERPGGPQPEEASS
jgi:uncharacterized protein (TIRG00374 family)